jgi:hypothetical protein
MRARQRAYLSPRARPHARAGGLTGTTGLGVVYLGRMAGEKTERPTVPPPFNVDRFAKESEARLAASAASVPDEVRGAESETRLVTRPSAEFADTDESWARTMTGSLVAVTPLADLKGLPLDHRAAYLLSWMDDTVDLETLVQVSTMPRKEVIRIVRELYESGIVEFH